jgi:hypothetical protein
MAAAKKKIQIVLGDKAEKKNVVRYNYEGEGKAAMLSAYVSKDALETLGNPDKIVVTIEAA